MPRLDSNETITTWNAITPHDIMGCEPVTEEAASPVAAVIPINNGMLNPTKNMNKNEMPEAAIRSPRDSTCLVFITIPNTKAGSSTSI